MKSIATTEDMLLIPKLLAYTSPANIPLSFCYDGRLLRGIPNEFHPEEKRRQLSPNLEQIIVCGTDEAGLEIRAEYLQYRDYPVTEWVVYFTNRGTRDTPILSDIRVVDGMLEGENPVLSYGNGDTCGEDGYEWFLQPIDQSFSLSPADGTSCNGAFPYMRLLFEDYGINIAVGWPAMWRTEFHRAPGGVSFIAGQKRTHMVLHPGETIRTPRINLMGFTGQEEHGRNLWRRWYLTYILPRPDGQPLPPKYCLHVLSANNMPEFTGADEQNQLEGIQDYIRQDLRPDVWWIDAGWYPCDGDWPKTGSWFPDPNRFPNGLAPLGEKCRAEGTELLLWFEPERVRPDTELATEHPEWLVRLQREDGSLDENSLLNLGDEHCCDWIIERVGRLIRENHVNVYRQDFNFNPRPYWEQNETDDRIGAMENLHVQGYLRLWDSLLQNPGLWIDSCASGGRRNDLETMRRAVPLHYTDVGYGNHPIKQKQHREMFEWIPYFRAHNMSWDNPEDGSYVNGVAHEPDRFAYHAAMAPALTDMIVHNAAPEAFALARQMRSIWREAAELMLCGDYYSLTSCRKDPQDFYAMQFHDPEEERGFFQVLANTQCETGRFTACLHALEADALYRLTDRESGEVMHRTGRELMDGIPIDQSKRSGVIWFYHREKT